MANLKSFSSSGGTAFNSKGASALGPVLGGPGAIPGQVLSQSTRVTADAFTEQVMGKAIPVVIGTGPVPGTIVYGSQVITTTVYQGEVTDPATEAPGSGVPDEVLVGGEDDDNDDNDDNDDDVGFTDQYVEIVVGVSVGFSGRALDHDGPPYTEYSDPWTVTFLFTYTPATPTSPVISSGDGTSWTSQFGQFTFAGWPEGHAPGLQSTPSFPDFLGTTAPKAEWTSGGAVADTGISASAGGTFDEGLGASYSILAHPLTDGPYYEGNGDAAVWYHYSPDYAEIASFDFDVSGLTATHISGSPTYAAIATKLIENHLYILLEKQD